MHTKIKEIAAVVFDTEPDQVTEMSSPDTIEKWDSINHLNLVSSLEDEFGVTFTDEEVGEMLNLKLVEIIIEEKLKKA